MRNLSWSLFLEKNLSYYEAIDNSVFAKNLPAKFKNKLHAHDVLYCWRWPYASIVPHVHQNEKFCFTIKRIVELSVGFYGAKAFLYAIRRTTGLTH